MGLHRGLRGRAPRSGDADNADYLVGLAGATSLDPARPIWLQEIGVPEPDIPVGLRQRSLGDGRSVLPKPALWGVTWWSSHDIDRRLVDFPEREYDLGLFTVDHQGKPAGRALAQAVEGIAREATSAALRPALLAPDDLRDRAIDRSDYAPGSAFHELWVQRR